MFFFTRVDRFRMVSASSFSKLEKHHQVLTISDRTRCPLCLGLLPPPKSWGGGGSFVSIWEIDHMLPHPHMHLNVVEIKFDDDISLGRFEKV